MSITEESTLSNHKSNASFKSDENYDDEVDLEIDLDPPMTTKDLL